MTFIKTLTAAGAVALGLIAGTAHAATVVETSGAFGPIGNPDPVGATQTVDVTDNLIITDVNVKIFGLTTTWVGDLIISLISPTATQVDILCRAGRVDCIGAGSPFGDASNLGGDYAFDDEAATFFEVAVSGILGNEVLDDGEPYVGMNLLSAFDGEFSAGTWTMTIVDAASGDLATAQNFELTITGDVAAVPLPASLPLLAGGLALIGWHRRRA